MNSKVNAFAFVLTLISAVTFADAPKSVAVTSTPSASVFNVHYKSSEAGRVKVSIVNSQNTVVYTEVLNNIASFSRPYNFSQLTEGEYTILVENKNGKQVEKVTYKLNTINSFIKVSGVVNSPNKYVLNIASTGSESVVVNIYSGQTLMHTEQVQVKNEFGVMYNLDSVKAANGSPITFEISTASGKHEVITF